MDIRELEQQPTLAEDAGIRLKDTPGPLYQLLVLATLTSARISTSVAVAATRELFTAGYRTPARMLASTWQDRVDALGRGHYRRYDESAARLLGEGARLCQQRWRGDLRRMRDDAGGDVRRLRASLTEFPGIGPAGADIFLREVQGVWPVVAPYVDAKAAAGARKLDMPTTSDELAALVPAARFPHLTAALVRAASTR